MSKAHGELKSILFLYFNFILSIKQDCLVKYVFRACACNCVESGTSVNVNCDACFALVELSSCMIFFSCFNCNTFGKY